jgi:hypothetical protein
MILSTTTPYILKIRSTLETTSDRLASPERFPTFLSEHEKTEILGFKRRVYCIGAGLK